MAARLVEFALDGSDPILVEVKVDDDAEGVVPAARPGEIATKSLMSFNQAMTRLRPTVEAIADNVRDLAHRPDELEVEFGVKLSSEAGIFLATAGAEANLTVRMRWKQKPDKKQEQPPATA